MTPVHVLLVLLVACSGSVTPASTGSEAPTPTVENSAAEEAVSLPSYPYPTLSAEEHIDVCAHTAEPASNDACDADSDCRICHDGSECGIPANLGTMRRRGEECAREDAAECEYHAVRCCDGHCRVVSH